jgi:putative tricarboxylic transport membrane protein
MRYLKSWNTVAALFVSILSVWLLLVAIPSEIPSLTSDEVSPRFYPNLGASLLGLLGILLLLQEWRRGKLKEQTDFPIQRWRRAQWETTLLAFVLVAYGFLVSLLGFYGTSFLLMIGLYIWQGMRNWWRIILISIVSLLAMYLLFEKGMRVDLPRF